MRNAFLGVALVLASPLMVVAQTAILQIKIIEGDGAVYGPGTRSARALSVLVTNEIGGPVAGVAISFHLPEDGPGGTFSNGLRTEVSSTDAAGRATVRGIQLNRISGPFQIRVLAAKDQARAGAVSNQYISELKAGVTANTKAGPRSYRKLLYIALGAAGVAAAGFAVKERLGASSSSSAPALTIGAPVITVGGH